MNQSIPQAGPGPELDFVSKLKQEQLLPVVERIAFGEKPRAPLVVELDPTSFCDLACHGCVSEELLNNGCIGRDRLIRLVSELGDIGVKVVIFIGGGEPLLHPAIGDAIKILYERGVQVGVTTNGTLIHRVLNTLAEKATWTRVSVDAGTREMYARFRPSRNGKEMFRKVISNMNALAKRKVGRLGYSFLVSAKTSSGEPLSNAGDVARAARLARDIGCDYFEIKPIYDRAHFLVTYPTRVLETLRCEMTEALSLESPTFRVIAPRTLSAVSNGERDQPKHYSSCPISQLRTLITPTGCFICPYHRGRPDKKFGDIAESSFKSVWDSAERDRVFESTDPSADCRFHCIRHSSNEFILGLSGAESQARSASHAVAFENADFFI